MGRPNQRQRLFTKYMEAMRLTDALVDSDTRETRQAFIDAQRAEEDLTVQIVQELGEDADQFFVDAMTAYDEETKAAE